MTTDQLNDMIATVSERIRGFDAEGERLARDPYQSGIRVAGDYSTDQRLLDSQETSAFLEVFGGNTEMALRVLRARLDVQVANLLPAGSGGLTLRFECCSESKELGLYTTPLYDSWHSECS